jgi:hypothetical protein
VALPDAASALHLARHTELLLRNWGGSVKRFMQATYGAVQKVRIFQAGLTTKNQQATLEEHAEYSVPTRPRRPCHRLKKQSRPSSLHRNGATGETVVFCSNTPT